MEHFRFIKKLSLTFSRFKETTSAGRKESLFISSSIYQSEAIVKVKFNLPNPWFFKITKPFTDILVLLKYKMASMFNVRWLKISFG